MSSLPLLAIFLVFGLVCGFYLSIVGFVASALVLIVLIGLVNPFFDGPFVPSFLIIGFCLLQAGFFFAVIGQAIALHISRIRRSRVDGTAAEDMRAKHDHPL